MSKMLDSERQYTVPNGLEVLFLGLLRRGPRWTARDTPEVEAPQSEHRANIVRMRESGELVIAGPFQDDGELQGVYVFRVESLDEAITLTNTDPAVKAGRFVFDLHPWLVPIGASA